MIFYSGKRGRSIQIKVEKDQRYFPNRLTYCILNRGKKPLVIQSVVLVYKKLFDKHQFKITGIAGSPIYPLEIQPLGKHELPISLIPFFDYQPKLRFYYSAYIEVETKSKRHIKSKRVILRPTFWRSERN